MKLTIKFRFIRKTESGNKYCTLLGFAISDDKKTYIIYLPCVMIGIGVKPILN